MAGSDQSVNLGGMLGQIAKTTGSMADAYKPVMQAATKPRGDMNDPAHLMRLAEWARSNGDATSAASYAQQSRRLADQATADAKQLRTEQGSMAMGNIQKGMNDVLRSDAPEEVKAERMAALEQAAMTQAGKYGMNAEAASGMGNKAREGLMREQATQMNMEITQRSLEEKKTNDALEQAHTAMEPEKFETFKKGQIAKGNGAAVKRWETSQLQYENAVTEANERAAVSGPLSDEESARAKEFGISVEGATPRTVRAAIRQVEVAKATQTKKSTAEKTANASVVKSLMPKVLEEMGSGNMVFDSGMDDWIEDALDDPSMMEALSAYVTNSGKVEQGPEALRQMEEAIKDYIVATQESGLIFDSASDEINEERGVQTVNIDGETVTIKEKTD
jgi:hypothetical protein